MIKHIFIFVGERMTGKTVLSNLTNNPKKVIIFDDVPPLDIRRVNCRRRLDKELINRFEYVIYNTLYIENVKIIANNFKGIPVTHCLFGISTIKSEEVKNSKKLGDMTIRELKAEQDKICKTTDCHDCAFSECCVTDRINFDQEIEVEENE